MRNWQSFAVIPAALMILAGRPARADVRLAGIFGDNMVLQQGMPVPIWGTGTPGEAVTVRFAGQTKTAAAGRDGRWRVRLDPLRCTPGNAAQELTVSGQNSVTLKNVLVGEVWFCSGQSNMGRTVNSTTTFVTARAKADNPLIRFCFARDAGGPRWAPCTADSVGDFSAMAYYAGRELQKALQVPVGLVWSAVGGTAMIQWTLVETVLSEPGFYESLLRQYRLYQQYQRQMADVAAGKAAGKPKGADPRERVGDLYNRWVRPFQPFAIKGVLWYQGEADASGIGAFAPKLAALIASWRKDWGQGDFPFLLVQLPPWAERTGHYYPKVWEEQKQVVAQLKNVGMIVGQPAASYHDIHPPNKEPLGHLAALQMLWVAYGRKDLLAQGPTYRSQEIRGSRIILHFDNVGGGLVARTNDLLGFEIAGVDRKYVPAHAWWTPQGKAEVFSSRVKDPVSVRYRQVTGGESAAIEFTAEQIANDAMIQKKEGKVLIDLDRIGGDRPAAVSPDGTLGNFLICGSDEQWVKAEARVVGDKLVVSSPKVKAPVAARYGWYADGPASERALLPPTLYNKEGLPASGFRTDHFYIGKAEARPADWPLGAAGDMRRLLPAADSLSPQIRATWREAIGESRVK